MLDLLFAKNLKLKFLLKCN